MQGVGHAGRTYGTDERRLEAGWTRDGVSKGAVDELTAASGGEKEFVEVECVCVFFFTLCFSGDLRIKRTPLSNS